MEKILVNKLIEQNLLLIKIGKNRGELIRLLINFITRDDIVNKMSTEMGDEVARLTAESKKLLNNYKELLNNYETRNAR